jgi:thiol:disulfide interchange protein DsbD
MRICLRHVIPVLLSVLVILAAACGGEDRRRAGPPVVMAARALPVTPEGVVRVSWYFDLAAGWHLYWPGINDSGFPPSLKLDLPDGWSARPLRWPVPVRLELPGGLLDHVYDQPLVVLEQDLVPPDPVAAAGQEIGAAWRWLACRQECVPGDTTLTVAIPYRLEAAAAAPPGPEPVFPAPLPDGSFTARWDGAALEIRAPGAQRLRFFPHEACGRLVDLLADGEAQGDVLRLRFAPVDGRVGPARGLLQIETAGGEPLTGPLDLPLTTITPPGGSP